MAFEEVAKAPTQWELNSLKRRYRKLNEKYNAMRQKFSYHIACEDFELLSVEDFLELKEIYIEKKLLYWKIFRIENPDDAASEKAYRFLNSMTFDDQVKFLQKHNLTTHRLIDAIRENPNFIEEVTA